MDGHAMTKGVIPVRHSSLPGLIKLPRRYEKAIFSDLGNSTNRRIKVCENPPGKDAVSNRLDDLMTATLWVKQELILLRQHDILLKRQFFNIQHSIQSLQSKNSHQSSVSSSSTSATTITTTTSYCDLKDNLTLSESTSRLNSGSFISQPPSPYSSIQMDTLLVRPSLSFKLLSTVDDNSDESDDDDDMFFDLDYYRPRTTSMRTSRDLAAVARRRGSKDLL